MKTFCFDIDGTLCSNTEGAYEKAMPFKSSIKKINTLYDTGNKILLYTARGATTGIDWSNLTKKQLKSWGVKYHKVFFGKPTADVYIDDKAINFKDWNEGSKWSKNHISEDSIFSVAGKHVVVTGAAQGNGYAIAKGFESAGARVIAIDKDANVKKYFSSKDAFICDLSNQKKVESILDRIFKEINKVDVLVNNAGISLSSKDPYSDDIFSRTLAVNLKAPFILSRYCARKMKKIGGGSIINITSLGAELAFPENPSYQISKAGLRQMTKALAIDFKDWNVRVNNVCPGYMTTSMTKKSFNDPRLKKERNSRMILKRWGNPQDLVGACIFLASEASAYITGSDIYVDGGWTAKGL